MSKLGKGIRISSDIIGKVTEVSARGAGKVVSSVAKKRGNQEFANKAENISEKIAGAAGKYSDKIADKLEDIAEVALDKGIDKATDLKEVVKEKIKEKKDKKKDEHYITVDSYKID